MPDSLALGVRLLDLIPTFTELPFAHPLKIGSGLITAATCLTVRATVETCDGRRGTGEGAILLSHVWAWPGEGAPAAKDGAMRAAAQAHLRRLLADPVARTPLDWYCTHLPAPPAPPPGEPAMPALAAAVAAAPIDSAIHAATGHAYGCASYDLLPSEVRRHLRREPLDRVSIMYTVGLADDAESLHQAVERDGIHGFKVKLAGDPIADAARTTWAYRLATAHATRQVFLSADGNESYSGPEAVSVYLQALPPDVFAALSFVEQPVPRTSNANMAAPAILKPILADEGWVTISDLHRLLQLGWSGAVLKTCKGHSAALLALTLLAELGRPYAVQDLTNPGIALIHSLGLAARCSPLAGLEANARQYLPDHHPAAFLVQDGAIATANLSPFGLGY